MLEEVTGTAPETAPVEVITAATMLEPQEENSEVQVERFTVAATFAPPSANDDARTIDAVWYTGAKGRGSTGAMARNTISSST